MSGTSRILFSFLKQTELSMKKSFPLPPLGNQAFSNLLVVTFSGKQLGKSLNFCMPGNPEFLLLEC